MYGLQCKMYLSNNGFYQNSGDEGLKTKGDIEVACEFMTSVSNYIFIGAVEYVLCVK